MLHCPDARVERFRRVSRLDRDPLLRDDGRWGNFESAGFRTALGFYLDMFQRGWAPPFVEIGNRMESASAGNGCM